MKMANEGISGFNNLTKVLSFNLYDFCITLNDEQRKEYVEWIHQKYSAKKIYDISEKVCEVIQAEILNASIKDFEPVGASTLVLMSDCAGDGGHWDKHKISCPESSSLNLHLDKSHITAHTYPDAESPDGICSFRVDLDIATCGNIIPLKAINYLFEAFQVDLVVADYVVRGYTRLQDGTKIFNDHPFNSIQEWIDPKIMEMYSHRSDLNMTQVHTWQTKMMIKNCGPERYLMKKSDINHPDVDMKMGLLQKEMQEIYEMLG